MPGMTSRINPRKIHNVTLISVLTNGRHRLRNSTNASRSFTGRKGAAVSCVIIIAVTPEITAAEIVVATNFNKLKSASTEITAILLNKPTGGQYLYQRNAAISSRLVTIMG